MMNLSVSLDEAALQLSRTHITLALYGDNTVQAQTHFPASMTAESSNALVRRSTDTELMPPPAKRIKRPQKILDEETYVSGISEIIARDFFPGLLETETKQEYLDALESQ